MKNECIYCTIGNAKVGNDNVLLHNSMRGAIEQHMHIKSKKPVEVHITNLRLELCDSLPISTLDIFPFFVISVFELQVLFFLVHQTSILQ